uniref:CS domain-containing protein n=1 Tax=Anas platyrhynchos platyrhynchos TaxID=8840 RepID=A0A493T1Q5_ANAPP
PPAEPLMVAGGLAVLGTGPASTRPPLLPSKPQCFLGPGRSGGSVRRENASRSLPAYFLSLCFQVSVDISSGAIRVAVLEGSSQRVLMEGKLTHKINTESSLWSLEPGKCVLVRPRASRVFHINRLPNSCAGVGASRSRVLAPVAIFAFSFPPRAHPRSVSGALRGWQQPQERFRGQGLAAAVLPCPAWGREVSRQCAHLSPRITSGAADRHPERVAGTSEGGGVW